MHGLGNDFVILDNPPLKLTPEHIRHIAHRRYGVGCDQVLVLTASPHANAHLEIWNADGTQVQACGNGTRCVIGLLATKNQTLPLSPLTVLTPSGLLKGWLTAPQEVAVCQGEPAFLSSEPLNLSAWHLPMGWAVTVGNPHLVIFVENVMDIPLAKLGPLLEHHPAFPHQTNVEFVQVGETGLRVRIWERGAGETPACGTGACASAFVALRQKRLKGPEVPLTLDGGHLFVTWQHGQPLVQRGPFETVCKGLIDL